MIWYTRHVSYLCFYPESYADGTHFIVFGCGSVTIHFMMTSSNGNIFRVTGHLCGEFTGHRWIPRTQRTVTRSFDGFFDLRQNKRLSKQWWGWWFETPSHPLWRHCNILFISFLLAHGPCIASMLGTDNTTNKARENQVHIYWDIVHCTFQMFTMSCQYMPCFASSSWECLVTMMSHEGHGVSTHYTCNEQ